MTATTTPADPRYLAKAEHYTARADAMQRQQEQLRRDGHRDRAARLQVSIDALRAAAHAMSEKARGDA